VALSWWVGPDLSPWPSPAALACWSPRLEVTPPYPLHSMPACRQRSSTAAQQQGAPRRAATSADAPSAAAAMPAAPAPAAQQQQQRFPWEAVAFACMSATMAATMLAVVSTLVVEGAAAVAGSKTLGGAAVCWGTAGGGHG
jgi:hypothetical protein